MTENSVNELGIIEAKNLLLKNGSISMVFDIKHKFRFKSCCQRIDKLNKLLRRKNKLTKFMYYIYAVYTSILNTVLTTKYSALDHAVDVYMISSEYISSIHGEPIDDGKFKVTYTKNT